MWDTRSWEWYCWYSSVNGSSTSIMIGLNCEIYNGDDLNYLCLRILNRDEVSQSLEGL